MNGGDLLRIVRLVLAFEIVRKIEIVDPISHIGSSETANDRAGDLR